MALGLISKEGIKGLKEQVAYSEQVKRIMNQIHAAKDLDQIFVELRDEILSLFDAERLTIYAVDHDQKEIYSKFLDPDTLKGVKEIRVPITKQSIAGFVAQTRETVNITDAIRNTRDVSFRIECGTSGDPKKAGLNGLKIEAIFQHNMFARPYLVGGRNRASVRVANPDSLNRKDLDFSVIYAWKEGRATKTHTQKITKSPTTYTIDVNGEDMPRMVRLEVAVAR